MSPQSAFSPRGPDAAAIADLGGILVVGATAVFAIVVAALWLAMRGSPSIRRGLSADRFVAMAGIGFPVVILSVLLAYGLWTMRGIVARADASSAVRVEVVGEQWWWRVTYRAPDGRGIESANEIRVPIGREVLFTLTSTDVIHSFWVPNLGGKMDMIPGRATTLRLRADHPGLYRGQCAEYCGGPHALMALEVVALPEAEFDTWLANEANDGVVPKTDVERRGRDLFIAGGCGACHAVRGTPAASAVGPDLTHVGSRRFIAAATLPATQENIARFIVDGQHLKPGNTMPPFRFFAPDELDALASYLAGLK
jgi:cytochrome c oxidase subunit 2